MKKTTVSELMPMYIEERRKEYEAGKKPQLRLVRSRQEKTIKEGTFKEMKRIGFRDIVGEWRSVNVRGAELHLKATDAGEGTGWGSDLGREVRERGHVVADDGSGVGEPISRELHPVAGISGKSNGYAPQFLGDAF